MLAHLDLSTGMSSAWGGMPLAGGHPPTTQLAFPNATTTECLRSAMAWGEFRSHIIPQASGTRNLTFVGFIAFQCSGVNTLRAPPVPSPFAEL